MSDFNSIREQIHKSIHNTLAPALIIYDNIYGVPPPAKAGDMWASVKTDRTYIETGAIGYHDGKSLQNISGTSWITLYQNIGTGTNEVDLAIDSLIRLFRARGKWQGVGGGLFFRGIRVSSVGETYSQWDGTVIAVDFEYSERM